MTVLITGAAGFLGASVVPAVLRSGRSVRAAVRPGTDRTRLPWSDAPGVSLCEADLARPADARAALAGCDGVVHLAALTRGPRAAQLQGTVGATETLLDAMCAAGVSRLVLASSLAVYDYAGRGEGETIDEASPLEPRPEARDAYAHGKLLQEAAVREFAERRSGRVSILRIGAVYGPGRLFSARIGIRLRERLWLGIGGDAPLPLCYVENAAAALALAAGERAVGATVNVLDDHPPTQRAYVRSLARHVSRPPRVPFVPWRFARALSAAAARAGGRGPALLAPARFCARFQPMHYDNRRAREVLGWAPRYPLEDALQRIQACASPT